MDRVDGGDGGTGLDVELLNSTYNQHEMPSQTNTPVVDEEPWLVATRKVTRDRNANPQLRAAAARWLTAYTALEALGIEEKRAFQDGVRLEHSIPEIVMLLNLAGERILTSALHYEQTPEPAASADLEVEYRRATTRFGEVLARSCR